MFVLVSIEVPKVTVDYFYRGKTQTFQLSCELISLLL